MVELVAREGLRSLAVDSICKSGTQSRKQISEKTVNDIREDIRDSNPIPPIVIFFDEKDYWVGDGYHRLKAHLKEKRDIINADVRLGSKDDALRFNIETNASADQTRWTNADKRNAVTMLLESGGSAVVTRARAEEIASMAKCHPRLVWKWKAELEEPADSADLSSKTAPRAQPPAAQAVTPKTVREQSDGGDEAKGETEAAKEEPNKRAPASGPNGRRSVEKVERDEQIAAMAKAGLSQTEIADQLGVSRSTVTHSFNRQKLTPETANPLVNVLKRAQLAASEWESIVTLFRDGSGTAASWPTATNEQKKEVIDYIKEAIRFQKELIKQLAE